MAAGPLYLAVNGNRATTVDLLIPMYGAAAADVMLGGGADLTSPITLTIGNLTMRMAVALGVDGKPRTNTFAGSTTARLVGGAGGWQRAVALAPYRNPAGVMLSTVLTDLAKATGTSAATRESVVLASGLDRSLGAFFTPEGAVSAGRILSLLAGPLWWVDVQGVTQIANARPSSAITSATNVVDFDGGRGLLIVATEDPAAWMPGATYTGQMLPRGVTITATRVVATEDGKMRVEAMTA